MVPRSWQYLRCLSNEVKFSSTRITFDRLYQILVEQYSPALKWTFGFRQIAGQCWLALGHLQPKTKCLLGHQARKLLFLDLSKLSAINPTFNGDAVSTAIVCARAWCNLSRFIMHTGWAAQVTSAHSLWWHRCDMLSLYFGVGAVTASCQPRPVYNPDLLQHFHDDRLTTAW